MSTRTLTVREHVRSAVNVAAGLEEEFDFDIDGHYFRRVRVMPNFSEAKRQAEARAEQFADEWAGEFLSLTKAELLGGE